MHATEVEARVRQTLHVVADQVVVDDRPFVPINDSSPRPHRGMRSSIAIVVVAGLFLSAAVVVVSRRRSEPLARADRPTMPSSTAPTDSSAQDRRLSDASLEAVANALARRYGFTIARARQLALLEQESIHLVPKLSAASGSDWGGSFFDWPKGVLVIQTAGSRDAFDALLADESPSVRGSIVVRRVPYSVARLQRAAERLVKDLRRPYAFVSECVVDPERDGLQLQVPAPSVLRMLLDPDVNRRRVQEEIHRLGVPVVVTESGDLVPTKLA